MATTGKKSGTKSAKSSTKSARSSKSTRSTTATPEATASGGIDLQAIETELNSDAAAQSAFVKNPAKFLQERGFQLRAGDRTQLRNLARELTSGPRLAAGSDTGSEVGISIRIRRWIR